jgi:hypothetical protein
LRIAPSEISPSGQVVIIDHSASRDYHLWLCVLSISALIIVTQVHVW